MMKFIKPQFIMSFVCAVGVLTACGGSEKATSKEIMRTDAPDRRVQAVLVTKDYDATVPTVYELYIVPHGKAPSEENMVLRGDRFSDVALRWREPKLLEAHYKMARVFQFSNFWQSKEVDNFRYVVEIRLQPPEMSSSLPKP